MPRKHQPFTLKKTTILAIANNWNLICYSCQNPRAMNQLLESDEYLKIEGPFSQMPSPFLEELLTVIGERRSLTRKFFHILVQEQLQVFTLSFGTGEIHYGLQFLLRCKKLRKLSLAYLRHIEPSHIMQVIPHLTCLVSLNLNMTLAVDEVRKAIRMMGMLAKHCPNLCELDLTSTMISDKGILILCGALQNDGSKRCEQLSRLIVTDTRVTFVGAMAVLRYLPKILEFDFDQIFKVFEHLENECCSQDGLRLKLRTLVSTAACIRPDSIDSVARCCPNVEILSIMNAWMDNETLYRFMQFEKLCSLTVVNTDGLTVDYDEGILPLLQICGSTLENLILNKFISVDLISLGRSCPRLRKMALCSIAEYQIIGHQDYEPMFSRLSALELWFDQRTEFSTGKVLYMLLCAALNLSNLLVKKSQDFKLELFRSIWKVNPLKKLARLTLDGCNNIEPELMEEFLTMENDIAVTRIWNCAKINRVCRETLAQRIKDNNLDVYLEWFA